MRRLERIEGELRGRNVGDHEIEEALPGLQARGLARDGRRREVRQLRGSGEAPIACFDCLQVAHRLADDLHPATPGPHTRPEAKPSSAVT